LGILISSRIAKSSVIGVVRAKNARHEKPPMILAKTRNPVLNPSAVTARLKIPSSKICIPTPKNIVIKINVMTAKLKGIVRNFK
jgi:hypothetical protein